MKNVAAAVLACLIATPGFAQDLREPAQDADEIRRSVKDGQKVTVTDERGGHFTGKIDSLAGDSLAIVAAGRHVDVPYTQIVRIDRRGDKVIDGALVGFGLGAALGYLLVSHDAHGWLTSDQTVHQTLIFGGIGAAAGAVIDGLISPNRELYRRPDDKWITVVPTVSRSARGVSVSVSCEEGMTCSISRDRSGDTRCMRPCQQAVTQGPTRAFFRPVARVIGEVQVVVQIHASQGFSGPYLDGTGSAVHRATGTSNGEDLWPWFDDGRLQYLFFLQHQYPF